MELTGEKVIHAPQARVYDALHDAVILRQVLPGVQGVTMHDDGAWHLTGALKVGALRPTFTAVVATYNDDPPAGYSLRGEASAGTVGDVTGSAHVAMAALDAATTNVAYHVVVEPAGLIATLGSDKLDATARMLLAELFARLQLVLDAELVDGVGTAAAFATGPRPGRPLRSLHAIAGEARRHPPHERNPAHEYDSQEVRPARVLQQSSTTDATGAPTVQAKASVLPLAQLQVGTLPQTPYVRQSAEVFDNTVDAGRRGFGRWVMVAAGLVAIVVLLNDGFSNVSL